MEEHKQKQLDLQLVKEAERMPDRDTLRGNKMSTEDNCLLCSFCSLMEREAHKDKMVEERELSEATINEKRMVIEIGQEKVKIEKGRLEGLKSLSVDVTQVLIAECKVPDKTLRVENTNGATALHVHEELGRNRE